ncbi:zinc finger protein [Musa troglodytarum]|uniref:Zinc finger protein n=1 Tax=Musa troglodytarum TaxID=320322 RepID=A0A9E7K2U5_9LILI|nr:zinc finger protein [Musa troglodytarum]
MESNPSSTRSYWTSACPTGMQGRSPRQCSSSTSSSLWVGRILIGGRQSRSPACSPATTVAASSTVRRRSAGTRTRTSASDPSPRTAAALALASATTPATGFRPAWRRCHCTACMAGGLWESRCTR